jgi:hypothetical protein
MVMQAIVAAIACLEAVAVSVEMSAVVLVAAAFPRSQAFVAADIVA